MYFVARAVRRAIIDQQHIEIAVPLAFQTPEDLEHFRFIIVRRNQRVDHRTALLE